MNKLLKNMNNQVSGLIFKRHEKVSKHFLNKLALINKNYTKIKNFTEYSSSIYKLFELNTKN